MRKTYTRKQLESILRHYPEAGALRQFRLFSSGFENSNFHIQTEGREYVIKIFEGFGLTHDGIRFEVEVMEASWKAGVKTPHVHRNRDGDLATPFRDTLVILMDLIDGENMEGQEVSDQIVSEVGLQMGKMDTALAHFRDGSHTRQNYEFDLKNLLQLEAEIDQLPSFVDRGAIRDAFDRFAALKPQFDSLPNGIIHNDVVLHNLLVRDGKLKGIVDFSDMAFGPYIQNVAVSLAHLTFCYNWKPHQAPLFVNAYRRKHPLSPEECSLLYDLTAARFAEVITAFSLWNRTYGHEKKREEYIIDNMRFLEKFLAFGKKEFNALLGL